MYFHSVACPVKMNASTPVYFKRVPNLPPECESKMVPVRGDFDITTYLPLKGVLVPVIGPVANIIMFLGESGSIPGGNSS